MKIAILGGSFNPIHIGHLMLADSVIKELGYDKVIFVPTFIPPHKVINEYIDPVHRFNMVKNACCNNDNFLVSDCEIKREGYSYTYDTVCYLYEKYKNCLTDKIGLIMGQEVANEFEKWHEYKLLSEKVKIIIAKRSNSDCKTEYKNFQNEASNSYKGNNYDESVLSNFKYDHVVLDNPILPISSTEVRARIKLHKAWQYLVPKEVFLYIKSNKLYGILDE